MQSLLQDVRYLLRFPDRHAVHILQHDRQNSTNTVPRPVTFCMTNPSPPNNPELNFLLKEYRQFHSCLTCKECTLLKYHLLSRSDFERFDRSRETRCKCDHPVTAFCGIDILKYMLSGEHPSECFTYSSVLSLSPSSYSVTSMTFHRLLWSSFPTIKITNDYRVTFSPWISYLINWYLLILFIHL